MGDKYRYKTNVVYTGSKINEISEVDPTTLNYTLDFYLLFQLAEPVVQEVEGNVNYRLYHVKGRFKAKFLPQYPAFEQHVFGVHNIAFPDLMTYSYINKIYQQNKFGTTRRQQ